MVLTRHRFHLPHIRLPRLQPVRFTSMGLAIAVNVAVVMLLSLPKEHAFEPLLVDDTPIDVTFIPPPPVEQIQEVPPIPNPPERKVQPQQQVVPVELTRPTPVEPVIETPNPMSQPTKAVAVTTTAPTTPGPVAPPVTHGASVAYETAPPPRYPRDMLKKGINGKVVLRILVSPSGNPEQVEVETSSGHRSFDTAARDQVLRRWKFHPALSNGEPVRAWVRVPVQFTIHGG